MGRNVDDVKLDDNTNDRAEKIATGIALTSRRGVLCGALGASAVAVLAACSSQTEPSGGDGDSDDGGGDSGKALAKVDKIPVGGGIVAGSLILVRPDEDTVKAYDRACTHKGAQVDAPDDKGTITCPAHGSEFKAEDGSVTNGPAAKPLKETEVEVRDGEVFAA